ncbi:MAG: undecaprenyl diphosphate synthase family protein, partial [Pontimonas sp.]
VASGSVTPGRISEKTVAQNLYLPSQPDVDLFVRTSGERRTSNFLLWQSAYAEMVFLPTLWPDMTRVQLWEAIEEYQRRTRRFGGAVDQPAGSSEPSR